MRNRASSTDRIICTLSIQSVAQTLYLPELLEGPAAKQIEGNGVDLGEMNMLLLKKVEELTLYVIEVRKEIQALEKNN